MDDDSEEITTELLNAECQRYLKSPLTYEIDEGRLIDYVEFALDQMDYVSAWLLIGAALSRFADNDVIWLHLAFLLYEEGQYDYALVVLGKFKKYDYWAQSLVVLIDSIRNPERTPDGLRRLVAETETFQDDTLSNIISVARETDNYELFCSLLPKIAQKAQSRDFLWREVAAWAESRSDKEMVKRCVDNYIDEFPMDARAWELCASYYVQLEPNPEEAVSAAEYALAIDPKSVLGHLARFQAMSMKLDEGESMDDAEKNRMLDLIAEAVYSVPAGEKFLDYFASFVLSNDMLETHRVQELAYEFNKRYPCNRPIIDIMLRLAEQRGEWVIQQFVVSEAFRQAQAGPDDENIWTEWARALRSEHLFHASLTVLQVYYDMSGIGYDDAASKESYLEMLYLSGRYNDILSISDPDPGNEAAVMVSFIKLLAHARTAAYEAMPGRIGIILAQITCIDAWSSLSNQLRDMALASVCLRLAEWCENKPRRKRTLNEIDPYGLILAAFEHTQQQ